MQEVKRKPTTRETSINNQKPMDMKINFKPEHYARMKELAYKMLEDNEIVLTRFGAPLNIVELMHTQSINTLNNIRLEINKSIERLENQDEWTSSEETQATISSLR